jgi:hypothetical protein
MYEQLVDFNNIIFDKLGLTGTPEPLELKFGQLNDNYPGLFNWSFLAEKLTVDHDLPLIILWPDILSQWNILLSTASLEVKMLHSVAFYMVIQSHLKPASPFRIDPELSRRVLTLYCFSETIQAFQLALTI